MGCLRVSTVLTAIRPACAPENSDIDPKGKPGGINYTLFFNDLAGSAGRSRAASVFSPLSQINAPAAHARIIAQMMQALREQIGKMSQHTSTRNLVIVVDDDDAVRNSLKFS